MNLFKSAYNMLKNWNSPAYVRNAAGEYEYDAMSISDLTSLFEGGPKNNLTIAQNHPILTPAMLFVSKLYSQVRFTVHNKKSGKELPNHWIAKLLENPNAIQTDSDLQESLMFMMIAQGKAVLYKKKALGFSEPDSLYILNSDLIKWPSNFKLKMKTKAGLESMLEQKVLYDYGGENLKIKIKDLIFIYDSPNCLNKNPFENESRITGLKQALLNTNHSLIAKEIILKTNGKELISSKGGSGNFPLNPEDKKEMEKLFQANYGLGRRRRRTVFTKASVDYKSLHIALRDLGLDESIKVDGNLIYTALHIPKDILSLEAKKTTYNNFKESMVSYIQNEMQSAAETVGKSLKKGLAPDENIEIRASYDHLPVMQWYLMQKYEAVSKQAKALNDLLKTGVPVKIALKMCGFDENMELDEIWRTSDGVETSDSLDDDASENNNSEEEEEENDDENKNKTIVRWLKQG